MFSKDSLKSKFGSFVQKTTEVNRQFTESVSNRKINNTPVDTQNHTMDEVFCPFGAKQFVLTESTLIIDGMEYPYPCLTRINLINPPSNLTNGVAQTGYNGKIFNLAFGIGQGEQFLKMMDYANEQIDQAHGVTKDYKYLLNCGTNTKIEVYEDYLILHQYKEGVTAVVGNFTAGGSTGNIMMFSDIAVRLEQDNTGRTFIFLTSQGNTTQLPLTPEDEPKAQEIISYINSVKTEQSNAEPEFINEIWEPIVPSVREFPLGDKKVVVTAGMDAFNSYRNTFRDLAKKFSDAAKAEYFKRVKNLITYLEFFPKIYYKYIDALCTKAMDIFISEGIWTVTKESFEETHIQNYHEAIDEFEITIQSIELTLQKNVSSATRFTRFVPHLVGGGFGVKGAAKGILQAEAFNLVRDGVEKGLVKNASQISIPQQEELYGRIKPDNLFIHVYNDYWRIFISIVTELRNNGKDIWFPSDEQANRVKNIFTNMSNPNFPQNRKLEAFISILTTFPYSREYLKYMVNTYGENEQTTAIRNYFGYPNFDDPLLGM